MAKGNPLQEQLLKAGLVKKSQVSQVAREQVKARHGKGPASATESQREADRARAEKAEKDRQLAAEHTSFSQILENVRHRRAITLLAQPGLSMEQIAEQLGYSEVGNFIRAFRRWTGRTPARWRREPSVAAPPVPEPPRTG